MENKKMCCFYINDIHLITMLLPYLNEKLDNNTKIITCFESDLSESIKRVTNGIYGKSVKNLLKIDWSSKTIDDIQKLDFEDSIAIINGSDIFIKSVNKIALKQKCELLDCFEMFQGKRNMNLILEEYSYVVNTSGENKIENVFTKFPQKNYIS